MSYCSRKFTFDSAHRVLGSVKCGVNHGHTYLAEITCFAQELDSKGMVLDFGEIKSIIGKWIDDNWDHTTILNGDDPILLLGHEAYKALFVNRTPYVLHKGVNPTAENLVSLLGEKVGDLVAHLNVQCVHVRLWETPNCWADWHNPQFAAIPIGADPQQTIYRISEIADH